MGGWWDRDHEVRLVQCPISDCKRVFKSGKREPQCSNCHFRFRGDYNLYKTSNDRKNDLLKIRNLVKKYKESGKQMVEGFRKRTEENDKIIQEIEDLIRPLD